MRDLPLFKPQRGVGRQLFLHIYDEGRLASVFGTNFLITNTHAHHILEMQQLMAGLLKRSKIPFHTPYPFLLPLHHHMQEEVKVYAA